MSKVIVTLRTSPSVSVEIPNSKTVEGKEVELKRSVFGALRFFPGIPKAITTDELEFIRATRPDLDRRKLNERPYVESKRVDRRGASEAEVEAKAEKEGLSHLPHGRKLEVLTRRGKISKPTPKAVKSEPAKATRKRNGNGK